MKVAGFIAPTSICRHSPGDPACGSSRYNYVSSSSTTTSDSPDASKYEIEDVQRVGKHLVLKVKYPNCAKCDYEGNKVMVFLNVTEIQVLRWKRIDPHFRSDEHKFDSEAPSPAARFPASPAGWQDAINYANSKA